MNVAVLGETLPGEYRVALIPTSVPKLEKFGCEVTVVSGAGLPSHFSNEEYRDVGATIAPDVRAAVQGAGVVLKVQAPTDDEIAAFPEGVVLISLLSPLTQPELIGKLAVAKVTAFALELIPRITRAQSMDVLSSQATVAGYKAVLMGADELAKFLPMFMTAAGTIRPGKVLILGAGVAGLQAIATARRLGAKVEAFDVRPAVKEQIESLGATFLETEEEVTGEGEGGYAKELSEEQHQRARAHRSTHRRYGPGHHHGPDPGPAGATAHHRRDGGLHAPRIGDRGSRGVLRRQLCRHPRGRDRHKKRRQSDGPCKPTGRDPHARQPDVLQERRDAPQGTRRRG